MNKLLQSLMLASIATLTLPAYAGDPTATPASTPAASAPAKPGFVATVNGVAIPNIYADVVRKDLAGSGRTVTDENVRDVLISNELLAQEATKLGLDKPPEIQAMLDLQRKDTLGKLLIENYAKQHPVSPERIQAEYDRLKAKFGDTEYHAQHILVKDEAQANELIKKLSGKKPAKFEDLAKKYSIDTGSAPNGGDLGWKAPANYMPEFATAMTALKKGGITMTPVHTQYGWHIIKLEDTRKLEFPALSQVKDKIANKLMQEDVQSYLIDLRKSAKVEPETTP
jgi:peptidyl-prolyl cis-trans isomerase C